jgi:hypothetical protein
MYGGGIVAEFEGGAVGEEELGVAMTGGAGRASAGHGRAAGNAVDGSAGAMAQ